MKTTRRLLLSAVLGGITAVALSCADSSPVGVGTPGLAPQAGLFDGLIGQIRSLATSGVVPCTPLPHEEVTQTIGPQGGTIVVGPHALSIPPGALYEEVSITAVAPSDTVNRVQFFPEGLVFAEPATLSLSYANCDLSGVHGPVKVAHVTDHTLEIIEYLLTLFDCVDFHEIEARLEHFSTYAVAW
jgi:hypothetical protein